MLLSGVYQKTVRDHRTGALAWGAGAGLLMVVTLASFEQLAGTPEARAALVALAEQFKWFESAVGVDKPGGFATFRLGPMLGVFPSIWALLAASATLRGEEERGALDLVLSTPRTRGRVVVQKLAGVGTALLALAAVLGTLVWLGGVAARAEYGPLEAYVFALNVALTAAAFGAIALLVSQFTGERGTAAGITGALLALSFGLHSMGRVAPDLKWVSYLSPLYYAGLTKPLVPEVGISPGGMLVLTAIVAVCTGAAARLFARRDLGFGYRPPFVSALTPAGAGAAPHSPKRYLPSGDWSLRGAYLRAVRTGGREAVWWAVVMAVYVAWMSAVAKQLLTNLTTMAAGSPLLSAVLSQLVGSEQASARFLGMVVFTFLPLVLSAFATAQAARWVAEEEEGRTEMLLASPLRRSRLLLARYAAIATVVAGIALVVGASLLVSTAAVDVTLAPENVLAAALGLVPLTMVVAALGALLGGWLRAGAVAGVLTVFIAASFFLEFVAPAVGLPQEMTRLSIYEAYGTPLATGWDWPSMAALSGVTGLLLALATLRFTRKDLAR